HVARPGGHPKYLLEPGNGLNLTGPSWCVGVAGCLSRGDSPASLASNYWSWPEDRRSDTHACRTRGDRLLDVPGHAGGEGVRVGVVRPEPGVHLGCVREVRCGGTLERGYHHQAGEPEVTEPGHVVRQLRQCRPGDPTPGGVA